VTPLAPTAALLRGSGDPFYDLGLKLRESGPEIAHALQDPSTWLLGTAALFGAGALLAGAHAGYGPVLDLGHRALFRDPGEVLVGYRPQKPLGRRPVYLPLRDRFTGVQMVAPMGQAKTTTLEWLAYQDLESRLSVVVIETEGDLGRRLLPLAFWLGVPIRYFTYQTPEVGAAMKWNPLAGDMVGAAERAVTAFVSAAASGDDPFFKDFNSVFLRHSVIAVCAFADREGREATMSDLDRFVSVEPFRRKVLGVEMGGKNKGPTTVNAKNLPRRTRDYWQHKYYGEFTGKERTQFVLGLYNVIDGLLAQEMVENALAPKPGEPVLDMGAAMTKPGLTLVSIPQGAAPATARLLSTWAMEYFRQAVLARSEDAYPVSAYLDEVHSMLGHANSEASLAFSALVTQSRRRQVAFNFAYQSFSLLPSPLKESLATNARNKLISGGLQGEDAAEAIAMLGRSEEEVRDYRRTVKGLLGGPGTFSIGRRRQTVPRVSEEDLVYLPRGWWHLSRVRKGSQQRPVPLKSGHAPVPPAAYRDAFAPLFPDVPGEASSPNRSRATAGANAGTNAKANA
jgi:hypothetical protein